MAKGLSWAAIFLATMTIVLFWFSANAEWDSAELAFGLGVLAGFIAPLVAVVGLLLAKRGGRRAPRLARLALAFGIGAFAWPLLLFVPLFICRVGMC